MTHIIAFIFARGGSKGLPGKNIRPLQGKPLIAYAIQSAQAVPQVDAVMVSTDDEAIAEVARQYKALVPFMRPPELAGDTSPEWLAWQHAIRTVREQGYPLDIMLSVPATAPLRLAEDIQGCLEALSASSADMAFTVTPAASNPYFSMVTLDDGGYARLAMQATQRFARRQDSPAVYDIVPLAYAAHADYVLNSENMWAGKITPYVVPNERAIDIDTDLDFQIAEFLMGKRLEA